MRLRSTLFLLLVGFVVGVAVFFVLQRFGLLGAGSRPGEVMSVAQEADLAERRIASRFPKALSAGRGQELNFRLAESDLRDLALAALASRAEGRQVLEMTTEIEAEIEDGEIGVTLLLDLSKLPLEQLDEGARDAVDKITGVLPMIAEGSLPVGFYGKPEASGGRLKLTGDPRLRISILKLSVETASQRLGIPEEKIRDALVVQWPGWEVLRVSVDGEVLELVVRAA